MANSFFFRGVAAVLVAAAGAGAWAADDSDEPNNSAGAAPMVGTLGFVRTSRILLVDDQDWYRFHVPAPRDSVTVEVAYDGVSYPTSLTFDVRTAAGIPVASGDAVGVGSYRAVTGPLAAGDYLVRIDHDSGPDILDYTLRSFGANDADEPNDTSDGAPLVGSVGSVRTGRVLNFGDEDWYRFRVPAARDSVTVEVAYDTSLYAASLTVEVRSLAGAVLATGSLAGAEGPVRAVTGPVSAGDYLVRLGHVGGAAISDYTLRTFVNDDDDEPNDSAGAAVAVGSVGFVRTGRVLSFGDQDWYSFQVVAGGGPVIVDVGYDAAAYGASVSLEVRAPGGALIATGASAGSGAPLRAVTGPLAVGEYLVLVRHDGGGAVSDYALQAYRQFVVTPPSALETSLGATIDLPFGIAGGVMPYTLSVDGQFASPPGLVFDGALGRVSGIASPTGRFEFMVRCRDSGSPANTAAVMMTIVVNAKLDVRLGEFTAFALGKSATRAIPFVGGTAPFTTDGDSVLPSGVAVDAGGLEFTGAATTAGSAPLSMTVVDRAGLSDSVETTAVVCAPIGAFDLAEGAAASGVYFDAVKDSVVTLNVSTARRMTKRPLRAVLLGVDGTTAVAAKSKAGRGTASLTRFVVPATGRYYFVVAGESGPATGLVAKGRVAPPVAGAKRFVAFDANDRAEVSFGAVAGAVLTLSAKPDRKGMNLSFVDLIDPSGAHVAIASSEITTRAGQITLTRTLTAGGTWTVVVRGLGGPGTMSWKYKLRQPKGVAYSADE